MTGKWETNMITPLRFSDNRKKRRRGRRGVSRKEEVLCDGFVEYKPRVRGAAAMKRQHKKKFGRERKEERGRGRVRTKKGNTESSEKRKVGGRRCRSTVTMRYERNTSETHKRW